MNQRFIAAKDRIEEMDAYELRVERMVDKAHIAVGLVDTVPRSNLLAQIVRQMPLELSLTRFSLQTTEIKPVKAKPKAVATLGSKRRSGGGGRSAEEVEAVRPEPRRWKAEIQLDGLAPSLDEVSRFIDALVGGDVDSAILHGVWVNFNDSSTNEIVSADSKNWRHAHGPAYQWSRHGDARVCYAPGSFLQAKTEAYNALLSAVRRHARLAGARFASVVRLTVHHPSLSVLLAQCTD